MYKSDIVFLTTQTVGWQSTNNTFIFYYCKSFGDYKDVEVPYSQSNYLNRHFDYLRVI